MTKQTAIEGLALLQNKRVGDSRGWLGELVPGGAAHALLREGFGNLYLSVAEGEHISRAGHYHYRQSEIFFTITGSALWVFCDYREGSPTFGVTESVVFSDNSEVLHRYSGEQIGGKYMPGMVVPKGVYHVYWALNSQPVRVVCISTTAHDDTDYVHIKPGDVPGIPEVVKSYGILLS